MSNQHTIITPENENIEESIRTSKKVDDSGEDVSFRNKKNIKECNRSVTAVDTYNFSYQI